MLDPFAIYQNIHFIGIGGIGISALARLLHHYGHHISGTDQTGSHNLELLRTEGIDVSVGHLSESLPSATQLVIHTTAIDETNTELGEALRRHLPTLSYPQAIGELTRHYNTISICGTHGKTTVTALLGHTLSRCERNPTVIVGSLIPDFGHSNLLLGDEGNTLILESCEYQKAFLNYSPQIILLNNIDPEHLDYYHTAENYLLAFADFTQKLAPDGLLLANGDDDNIASLLDRSPVKCKTIRFGRGEHNDVILKNREVFIGEKQFLKLELQIPGEHNLLNATGVVALCHYLGLEPEHVSAAMQSFQGASRRLELKGHINSTLIYDDYGHTPAEIRATLAALKSKHGSAAKILCIFQPHQYSRTRLLFEQFCTSFDDAAAVYIPNIFRSRDSEEDIQSINVDRLVEGINSVKAGLAYNTEDFELTTSKAITRAADFDIIITMGAGDINRIGPKILEQAKALSDQS